MLGVPAQDHPDPAVGIDHPVPGGRAAESRPMPKGAVPTDPDGRREAVNVPVAAVRAPDGDLHRAGIVPVREAVEHHRGVGGSYRHRDRLSGSGGARSGADETTGRAEDLRKEQTSPAPARDTAVGAASRRTERYRHRPLGTLPPHRDRRSDNARVRRTVPGAVTFGAGSAAISSSQTWTDTACTPGRSPPADNYP